MLEDLKIDSEFASQIPPLTAEEFDQLEENIVSEGIVFMPIIVWHNVIVDGHNRYDIIKRHPELKYSTYEKEFSDRYSAIAWICKNQLGRRNLTPEQKKYLIGERYEAEKMAHGASDGFRGNQYNNDNSVRGKKDLLPNLQSNKDKSNKTRKQIAAETHTSDSYVKRAGQYAKGVNAAEMAFPGIKRQILSGEICPTEAAVKAVADAPQEERENLAKHLQDESVQRRGKRQKKRRERKEETEDDRILRQIVEGLRPKVLPKVDENSMLVSLQGVADAMISGCNRCFREFPTLLTEQIYREQVLDILKEPKEFILSLEQGGQNPSNAAPSDTSVMPEELCATNATITNEEVYL